MYWLVRLEREREREREFVCVCVRKAYRQHNTYISDSFSCLAEDVVVKCNGLVVGLKLVNLTDLFCIFVEPIEMHSSNLQ